jgi:hypothetical protein
LNAESEPKESESKARIPLLRKVGFSLLFSFLFFLTMTGVRILAALVFGYDPRDFLSDQNSTRVPAADLFLEFLVYWLLGAALFLFGWVVAERKGEA